MVSAVEKREANAPRGGPGFHGAFETGLRRVAKSRDKLAGVSGHGAEPTRAVLMAAVGETLWWEGIYALRVFL